MKEIKDTQIAKRFSIPYMTLVGWKNREESNWRRKLYIYLKERVEREAGKDAE